MMLSNFFKSPEEKAKQAYEKELAKFKGLQDPFKAHCNAAGKSLAEAEKAHLKGDFRTANAHIHQVLSNEV